MNDSPRRRRIDPDEPRGSGGGGGIPIFPLILVVVFAGLLLGSVLAHFLGRGGPAPTTVAATSPSASPTSAPTATVAPSAPRASTRPSEQPSPGASPSPTPALASPTPAPSPARTPKALAIVATPVPRATATPTPGVPMRIITPAPKAKAPQSTPSPISAPTQASPVQPGVTGTERASAIVRAYLGALARGDQSSATSYLQSGLPNETFMSGAKVTSVRASSTDGGTYRVSADIDAASGVFFETFTLEPGPQGLVIVEHTAIKPQ